MANRGRRGGYAVVVFDRNRGVVEELSGLQAEDVDSLMEDLHERYGPDARLITNAHAAHAPMQDRDRLSRPRSPGHRPVPLQDEDDEQEGDELAVEELGPTASLQLMHQMVWQNFRQATQAQAWLMQQSHTFTQQLLDGNRRLADQASDLQRRYQERLTEIDYSHREQKMMEHEAASRRLSRHITEKSAAEIAASRPGRGSDVWEDFLDGVTTAIDAWVRMQLGDRNH